MLSAVPKSPHMKTVRAMKKVLDWAMGGKVAGSITILIRPGGKEEFVCTGVYEERPADAVKAALKTSMLLTRMCEQHSRAKPPRPRGPRGMS